MKFLASRFIFMFLFASLMSFATTSTSSAQSKSGTPKNVSIELQWEENPNAISYEIQLLDFDGKLLQSVVSKTSQIKFNAPVKKYKIRGRYTTRLGNKSPWSTEETLEVTPAKPKIENAADPFTFLSADENGKELPKSQRPPNKVKMQWKPVAQAEKYKVRIYSKDKKQLIKEFVTSDSYFLFDVTPGEFTVSIAAIGSANIESEESFIKTPLKVDRKKLTVPVVEKIVDPKKSGQFSLRFAKSELSMAAGEIYYSKFLSQDWVLLEKKETLELFTSVSLQNPGKYKLVYWATDPAALDSDKTTEEFIVKPKESDLN